MSCIFRSAFARDFQLGLRSRMFAQRLGLIEFCINVFGIIVTFKLLMTSLYDHLLFVEINAIAMPTNPEPDAVM